MRDFRTKKDRYGEKYHYPVVKRGMQVEDSSTLTPLVILGAQTGKLANMIREDIKREGKDGWEKRFHLKDALQDAILEERKISKSDILRILKQTGFKLVKEEPSDEFHSVKYRDLGNAIELSSFTISFDDDNKLLDVREQGDDEDNLSANEVKISREFLRDVLNRRAGTLRKLLKEAEKKSGLTSKLVQTDVGEGVRVEGRGKREDVILDESDADRYQFYKHILHQATGFGEKEEVRFEKGKTEVDIEEFGQVLSGIDDLDKRIRDLAARLAAVEFIANEGFVGERAPKVRITA